MQKAIIVERSENRSSVGRLELESYLAKGWVVDKMEAFNTSAAAAIGNSYGSTEIRDRGAILVIVEDLGVADPE